MRWFFTFNVFDFSLSGGELFDRIAAEDYKMTEAEVINYLRQVCEGLKHMHEHSIVHLDVKVRLRPYNLSNKVTGHKVNVHRYINCTPCSENVLHEE